MFEEIKIINREKVLKLLKEIEKNGCRCDHLYNPIVCGIHQKIKELKYMIGLGN